MRECYFSKYEPIFGSWHITEELGEGKEGHLFRIRREDAMGHEFYSALKAISIPAGGDAELESLIAAGMSREEAVHYFDNALDNTANEFELLEKLKGNSNIVSYEDHEIYPREEGFGWDILIRMEELTPLVNYSVYHKMDEKEIIRIGKEICRGLMVCRQFGIIHRDIKPENIFISAAGNYKLGDFGIARIVEETETNLSRKGTYTYMAPEIYWGKEYDHRADIYSLGLVMFRFLNDGRMPFMPVYPEPAGFRDGEAAFIRRINGEEIPSPRNGSDGLKAIIQKACAYDRDARYTDAGEMIRDLEMLENGAEPTSAALAKGINTDESQKRKKGKTKTIAACIAALCLAACAAYAAIPKEVEDIEVNGIEDGAELYIDDSAEPQYTVLPDWFKDEPVTFSTDNPEVLKVDDAGRLSAGIPGEAVLTMKAKEYSESIHIKVVPKVTSIDGIDKEIYLIRGNTITIEPKLKPEKFADEQISFSTEDEGIATVSEGGTISAVDAGETELTVTAGGTSTTATVIVSNPVVYKQPSASKKSSGKSSSGSSSGSGSGPASKGYFDSADDEAF